jgi:hypothetical protein
MSKADKRHPSERKREYPRDRKRKERLSTVTAALLCAGPAVALLGEIIRLLMIRHGVQ